MTPQPPKENLSSESEPRSIRDPKGPDTGTGSDLTPRRIFFIILLASLVTEMFVMALLALLPPFSTLATTIIDATLLSLLLVPILYRFLYRPLKENADKSRAIEIRMLKLAHYDLLTGLPNRALFEDHLVRNLALASREERQLALLFLDLDNFKNVNDRLGHGGGDQLLKSAGERLKKCLRASDILARLGGDEFVVLMPRLNQFHDVTTVATKILEVMGAPFSIMGTDIYTTPSIGISLYPMDGTDGARLLQHADMAMYEAKHQGRNTYQFFSEDLNKQTQERLDLEAALHSALEKDELFLAYQPQFDSRDQQIIGIETLLRWQHPERGLVSPGEFIPVAESSRLILPIGEWVLRTACREVSQLHQQWQTDIKLAVNISGRQFKQPDFLDMVSGILKDTGLPPQCLELELTESILMEDAELTGEILGALKEMKIELAIDDFGTGYSSLNYLKNFPLDRLKIDQSFVRDLADDPSVATIVETIIAMARTLGMEVIAEGVENAVQIDFLTQRDCFEMQGYYFGKPMPLADITKLLKQ